MIHVIYSIKRYLSYNLQGTEKNIRIENPLRICIPTSESRDQWKIVAKILNKTGKHLDFTCIVIVFIVIP